VKRKTREVGSKRQLAAEQKAQDRADDHHRAHPNEPTIPPLREWECHCIIRHVTKHAARQAVVAALESARQTGDSAGVALALAQLGPCPKVPSPRPT
jgi:hypothetical protein